MGFFGYRVGVFELAGMKQFGASFQFDLQTSRYTFLRQTALLLCGAAVVRALYLMTTTAISGVSVNYAHSAESIATGLLTQLDLFWTSPFSYWEALFRWIGLSPVPAAITASFIPGVLLLIPTTLLTRFLFGEAAAWWAGWMTVFHPRLVEYACNGLPDGSHPLGFVRQIPPHTSYVEWGNNSPCSGNLLRTLCNLPPLFDAAKPHPNRDRMVGTKSKILIGSPPLALFAYPTAWLWPSHDRLHCPG